ncbi:MAG: putative esterase/lipase/thioesterase [Actinomycetia bacterium]|nr:putative esterase/lipase/thioesterase [Actinomycetes bacterium]
MLVVAACSSPASSRSSAPPSTAVPSATDATVPSACTPARVATPAVAARVFRYAGQDRSYFLALPARYDGSQAYPLVFDFHGFAGRKEALEALTHMGKKGTARGFIVVTPDSLENPPQWNMFGSPGQPDDFGFVHALVADLERRLCIDPKRVYAAGHSNGSAFSAFLVCTKPYLFAAVAMVSATTPAGCPSRVAPSVLAIAGTADPLVPYAGGSVGGSSVQIPAARTVIDGYAKRYGCDPSPKQDQAAKGVTRLRYQHCTGGLEVVLDTVVGGTHYWPGGADAVSDPTDSAAGKTFAATDEILDFFARHRRP